MFQTINAAFTRTQFTNHHDTMVWYMECNRKTKGDHTSFHSLCTERSWLSRGRNKAVCCFLWPLRQQLHVLQLQMTCIWAGFHVRFPTWQSRISHMIRPAIWSALASCLFPAKLINDSIDRWSQSRPEQSWMHKVDDYSKGLAHIELLVSCVQWNDPAASCS